MPYYPDELMIGTLAGGVGGMVAISSLGQGQYASAIAEEAFTVDPVHRSTIVTTLDGFQKEMGWLQAAWHINGLRAEQYDAIIAYKDEHSTRLYIRTLMNDGETFANYLVISHWPVKPARGSPTAVEAGVVQDFTIVFTMMEEQV
jgi:hypothetical protein